MDSKKSFLPKYQLRSTRKIMKKKQNKTKQNKNKKQGHCFYKESMRNLVPGGNTDRWTVLSVLLALIPTFR